MDNHDTVFCVNCKHYRKRFFDYAPRCLNKQLEEIDLVTGKHEPCVRFCSSVRIVTRLCGEQGRWFQQKED